MNPLGMTANTLIALTLVITLSYYALMCWIRPFKPCRACNGLGRTRGRFTIRPCRPCRATGRRLRAGRALWNSVDRGHRKVRRREQPVRITPANRQPYGADRPSSPNTEPAERRAPWQRTGS